MFIDMQDAAGNYLEFDVGIYDFSTEEITEVEETNEMLDTSENEENSQEDMSDEEDATIEVTEAATMVTQTPDTGAETWVLIIATLFINTFYYLSRRKKSVLA